MYTIKAQAPSEKICQYAPKAIAMAAAVPRIVKTTLKTFIFSVPVFYLSAAGLLLIICLFVGVFDRRGFLTERGLLQFLTVALFLSLFLLLSLSVSAAVCCLCCCGCLLWLSVALCRCLWLSLSLFAVVVAVCRCLSLWLVCC